MVITIAGIAVIYLWLHARTPGLYGTDAYYHVKMARAYREGGMLYDFSLTPHALFGSHFADKEVGFHLLLAAFSWGDWDDLRGAKVFGAMAATLIYITLGVALKGHGCRHAWVFVCLLLVASPTFLFRTLLIRPHLLNISLALLSLYAVVRRSPWLLFVGSLVTGLCYSVPLVPVGIAVLGWIVRRLTARRPSWVLPVSAVCGVGLAVLVHPHFPENVVVGWYQAFPVLYEAFGDGGALVVADELRAVSTRRFLGSLWPSVAFVVYASCRAAVLRDDDEVLIVVCAAAGAGVLTAWSVRFTELFVPFSVYALAIAITRRNHGVRTGVAPTCP